MADLLIDLSLWSADLTHLAESVTKADPFVDSYHLDACDGHFAPVLLFFPDLVAALRPLTQKPFHVHLMAVKPAEWIGPFADAGANMISIHQPVDAFADQIHGYGCKAGLALGLDAHLDVPKSFDFALLMGTKIAVKGVGLDPHALGRFRKLRKAFKKPIYADGAIRMDTAPLLREVGADALVPGSLFFDSPDMAQTAAWLHGLPYLKKE